MNPGKIPIEFLKKIFAQAEQEYPSECCGLILGPASKPSELSRVVECKNVQDSYHQMDPANFPRTSATAYSTDSAVLFKIQKDARQSNEQIKIIYHSHVDTGAYFSEEDARVALSGGEPAYPGVDYLVVSVLKGKTAGCNLFRWDGLKKEFAKL